MKLVSIRRTAVAIAVPALLLGGLPAAAAGGKPDGTGRIDKIVVIYQENRSFDNLYGGWERVRGLAGDPTETENATQVAPDGTVLPCLPQTDVNLTSPPLLVTCTGSVGSIQISSAFENQPFRVDDYIKPEDTTCPAPGVFAPNGIPKGSGLPGG
ncbi:MAG TPA: alkaline phosphatase family protein, partial [Nocardioides sp.]